MNATQIFNHSYNVVCILCAIFAALPPSVIDVLPAQAKPYIIGIAGALMWIKSHRNLFISPDGSNIVQTAPAQEAVQNPGLPAADVPPRTQKP